MVVDIIQDGKPVARRCLGVGSVGPKLGENTSIVAARNDLRLIRLARVRVDFVPSAGIAAI